MQISPVSLTALASPTSTSAAARPDGPAQADGFAQNLAETAASGPAQAPTAAPPKTPFEQLEALLVQQMLQSMLSSEEGGFFGEGLGSDYYASFMAEHFGAALADSIDLGLASQLEGQLTMGSK